MNGWFVIHTYGCMNGGVPNTFEPLGIIILLRELSLLSFTALFVESAGVVPRLVELLQLHNKNEVGILSPALRCIGNIVTGSDEQTQSVIDAGALPIFHALLTHHKIGVQKEAAWTLSNITAGTQVQIQAVVQSELVPLLVHVLATSELRVQKEAAWAITNYTSGASTEQVLYLVQCQVIKPICDLMTARDPKLVKVLLDGLCNILLVAEKVGQLEQARVYIEEIDGLTKIEKLQENENEEVYKLAYHMVEKFFSDEVCSHVTHVTFLLFMSLIDLVIHSFVFSQGDEDQGLQPEVADGQYNFISTELTTASVTAGADGDAPKFSF